MSKPKLDIRQMIRDGKISTDRAGQLVALEVYENSGLISDSDVRALKETVKDKHRYNAYMNGVNQVIRYDNAVAGIMTDARLLVLRLAWALSELRFTVHTVYKKPAVVVATDDGYKRLGKDKRGRRLKRTYTLMTLYRLTAEGIIKKPITDEQKEAVANLRKEADEQKDSKNLFGIDLIEGGGEIWTGWYAYHKPQDFTLADLADDLPEYHALIMDIIKRLYKDKQLSIDPESVPLEDWHKTPLKGTELATMTDVPMLEEWLNLPESRDNILDEYDDEGDLKLRKGDMSERAYFERYGQSYALISQPHLYKNEIVDGVLDTKRVSLWNDDDLWTRARFGYGAIPELAEGRTIEDDMALNMLKSKRGEIINELRILYVVTSWRSKAGKLLGIDKGDRFALHTRQADPQGVIEEFNNFRNMYYGSLSGEHVSEPEYYEYLKQVRETIAPLMDMEAYEALPLEDKLNLMTDKAIEYYKKYKDTLGLPDVSGIMGYNWLKQPYALTEQLLLQHKTVASCIERINKMTLETIPQDYDFVSDELLTMTDYLERQNYDGKG